MLWSVIRLIFETSLVTPDFFNVFNLILSFSTCSQSFKKICLWQLLGANVLKDKINEYTAIWSFGKFCWLSQSELWYNNSNVVQKLAPFCIPCQVVASFLHELLLNRLFLPTKKLPTSKLWHPCRRGFNHILSSKTLAQEGILWWITSWRGNILQENWVRVYSLLLKTLTLLFYIPPTKLMYDLTKNLISDVWLDPKSILCFRPANIFSSLVLTDD